MAIVVAPAAVPRGIGFAPEAIALAAIRRAFLPSAEQDRMMTASLISPVWAGLVAMAAGDGRA
ncbi:hypothetical protein BRAS3809_1430015 [Bradyrhizobium sp. STM 3809]|nr:hypothetical protein BRAS3809_1430015 [Bradyrhizobium sp. STM 3809]